MVLRPSGRASSIWVYIVNFPLLAISSSCLSMPLLVRRWSVICRRRVDSGWPLHCYLTTTNFASRWRPHRDDYIRCLFSPLKPFAAAAAVEVSVLYVVNNILYHSGAWQPFQRKHSAPFTAYAANASVQKHQQVVRVTISP